MASGNDLVIIFLGLEILSIATYVMAGFRRTDVRANESSLKYFILGSFSSAFLLYGIALTYGATSIAGMPGTTNITEIANRLREAQYPPLLFAGAAMMLVGFGFKIATAPFHVWTPDVYEGAPTPVTAFFSVGPKLAAYAILARIFYVGFPKFHADWGLIVACVAAATMIWGNLAALLRDRLAPDRVETIDWRWSDERMGRLRELGAGIVRRARHRAARPARGLLEAHQLGRGGGRRGRVRPRSVPARHARAPRRRAAGVGAGARRRAAAAPRRGSTGSARA